MARVGARARRPPAPHREPPRARCDAPPPPGCAGALRGSVLVRRALLLSLLGLETWAAGLRASAVAEGVSRSGERSDNAPGRCPRSGRRGCGGSRWGARAGGRGASGAGPRRPGVRIFRGVRPAVRRECVTPPERSCGVAHPRRAPLHEMRVSCAHRGGGSAGGLARALRGAFSPQPLRLRAAELCGTFLKRSAGSVRGCGPPSCPARPAASRPPPGGLSGARGSPQRGGLGAVCAREGLGPGGPGGGTCGRRRLALAAACRGCMVMGMPSLGRAGSPLQNVEKISFG